MMKKLRKGALTVTFAAAAAISLSACEPPQLLWEASAQNALNRAGYTYNGGELVSTKETDYNHPKYGPVDAEQLVYKTVNRYGSPATVTVNCFSRGGNGIICKIG